MTKYQWSYAATKARHRLHREHDHKHLALKLAEWLFLYAKGCREEALYLKLMGRI